MKVNPINLPAFGQVIAGQGGIFAGIMRGPVVDGIEQPPFALVVSDRPAGEIEKCAWGQYGKAIDGTTSRSDGQANTEAMAAAECDAAVKVRAMSIDGHSDWYLPSIGELNTAAANVPEQFSTDGYYWTSTQLSRCSAFVQVFEDGGSLWDSKGYERRVRAFRRVQLDALTT